MCLIIEEDLPLDYLMEAVWGAPESDDLYDAGMRATSALLEATADSLVFSRISFWIRSCRSLLDSNTRGLLLVFAVAAGTAVVSFLRGYSAWCRL